MFKALFAVAFAVAFAVVPATTDDDECPILGEHSLSIWLNTIVNSMHTCARDLGAVWGGLRDPLVWKGWILIWCGGGGQ